MADEVWGFDRDRAERLKRIADENVPINSVNLPGRRRPTAMSGAGLALTPSGGIPARSGITVGVATCTLAELYDDAGVVKIRQKSPAESVLIYNTTAVNVSGAKWIHWKMDGGYRIVDVDDCA